MEPTTPRPKSEGKYANPTIKIVVGKKKPQLFHVHYAFLDKTDFFKVHSYPSPPTGTTPTPTPTPIRAGSSLNSSAQSEATVTPDRDDIKGEQDIEDETSENDGEESGASPAGANGGIKAPAYTLQGLIYEPAAFEVVVNYLYNEMPIIPSNPSEVKVLMKAYILALQYRMSGLQDELIDCLRNFYASTRIRFSELFWVSGRIGDGEAVCKVPLIQYFVAQIAWEIYQGGYDTFTEKNRDFELFLTHGDRPLRRELFKAIAEVAQDKKRGDPALGLNHWRVLDYPNFELDDSAPSQTLDIIDID